jgi:RNA polymerase sigma-70 factor (ECF subfamily)
VGCLLHRGAGGGHIDPVSSVIRDDDREGEDVTDSDLLAQTFEGHRDRLRGLGRRLLGSGEDADEVVQEAWLRLSRADADAVDNLGGWLTAVVGRICIDVLRTRELTAPETLAGLDLDP